MDSNPPVRTIHSPPTRVTAREHVRKKKEVQDSAIHEGMAFDVIRFENPKLNSDPIRHDAWY